MVIGVCTADRPAMLTSLLAAVAGQRALDRPDLSASVLVVDNSPAGSGLDAAHAFADRAPLPVEVRHVPERGLSRARNAVLDAADGDLLAFIDDDEIPEPWWLGALLDSHRATSAPIITGPVIPRYGPAAPGWLVQGRFLELAEFPDGARLREAISGNALLDLGRIREAGLHFDPRYDRTGGEDQLFFRQAAARGLEIRYAAGATVHETVPESRTTFRFLLKRELRKGNTLGLLARHHRELGESPAYRALAAAKWGIMGILLLVSGSVRGSRVHLADGVLRGTRAVGMMGGLVGWRYPAY